MVTVDWRTDSWFAFNYADELTEEFKAWWMRFHGLPDQYNDNPDEQDEYWTRCAFAWNGWKAREDS
jgi:hypothetical protein